MTKKKRSWLGKRDSLVRFFMSESWKKEGRCEWCGSGEIVYTNSGSSPMFRGECLECGKRFDV